MRKVLIIGYGYLGHYLAQQCQALGWQAIGVCRSPANKPQDNVTKLFSWDVSKSLPSVIQNLAITDVIYCVSAAEYSQEAYNIAYNENVSNVVSELQNLKKLRFIFVSSSRVYCENRGARVVDDSQVDKSGFANAALLAGERHVLNNNLGLVVRVSGIYGENRIQRYLNWHKNLLNNEEVVFSRRYINCINVVDVAAAIFYLLQLPDFIWRQQQYYLISDGQPILEEDLLCWFADKLRVNTNYCKMAEPTRTNKQCIPQKLQQLGFTWRYPNIYNFLLKYTKLWH